MVVIKAFGFDNLQDRKKRIKIISVIALIYHKAFQDIRVSEMTDTTITGFPELNVKKNMNEKHSVDESRIWQFDKSVIQKHRNNTAKIYISLYFIDELIGKALK